MKNAISLLLIAISSCTALAASKTEIGKLENASFRIDVPANWAGELVIYCHGYSPDPVVLQNGALPSHVKVFIDSGVAVAQSGLSHGSWSIETGSRDTEELRRYFIRKYGRPKKTFIVGESMGGFLAMVVIETKPKSYNGAMVFCAPLDSPNWFLARRVFDLRVVLDFYFPGVFPRMDALPLPSEKSLPHSVQVEALLDNDPAAAESLRLYSGIHSNRDLARTVVFFTTMLDELAAKTGGNPFGNGDVVYEGTENDNLVNEGVTRYKSNPAAAAFVRRMPGPTGRLRRPLLSLETTYDPLIPGWAVNRYQSDVAQAGNQEFFSQKYVKGAGHCAISAETLSDSFSELQNWASGKMTASVNQPDSRAGRVP